MHFGKSKVIFDSFAFLLVCFLSVVFIQVLKNITPLKMSVSTVYIQQVTYKTVLQYHVSEYITQFLRAHYTESKIPKHSIQGDYLA